MLTAVMVRVFYVLLLLPKHIKKDVVTPDLQLTRRNNIQELGCDIHSTILCCFLSAAAQFQASGTMFNQDDIEDST